MSGNCNKKRQFFSKAAHRKANQDLPPQRSKNAKKWDLQEKPANPKTDITDILDEATTPVDRFT